MSKTHLDVRTRPGQRMPRHKHIAFDGGSIAYDSTAGLVTYDPAPQNGPEPEDYLSVNRRAYDGLVEQYAARLAADAPRDTLLMEPFFELLARQFGSKPGLSLLDVGCGNGLNLQMMIDKDHLATGVDVSPRMAELARSVAPKAKVVVADFLDRGSLRARRYHGVFAKAIVHLFPKRESYSFFTRVKQVLRPGGVFYVTTTVEEMAEDGACAPKRDYRGAPIRYRSRWTPDELKESLERNGFRIEKTNENEEPTRNKVWINYWAVNGERNERQY
jgi:SAM-dependent methyltransferase